VLIRLLKQAYSLSRKFCEEREMAKDFYLGLILLAFALILLLWLTPTYVSGPLVQSHLKLRPNTFPNLIAYVLAFLAILLIYNSPRSSKDGTRIEDKRFSWFIIFCLIILFAYYLGVQVIGMLPASIVIMFVLMRLYGLKSWVLSIIIAVILPCILFFFFEKVAQVPIPRGIFFEDLY
jgi:putative tricarboxylic transport membrane protein